MLNKVELLSPAGDLERLKIALLYGADAVYIGGQDYSLRANANNFSIDDITEACSFAHKLNKKVYLTLNIVFHNEDIDGVYEYIKKIVDAKIDAFIVSDLFIVEYIKNNFDVEVHISTQDSITNYESVLFLKDQKVDRVVLAREVNVLGIKEIIEKTDIDIEVFIHGAMCTLMSGRCTLSNYITNRDSNRGGCAQVCRFAFTTNEEEKFTFATKDLNMSHYIKELINCGVKSLKVEGRMRSHYYLATVIGTYRKIIDKICSDELTKEFIEECDRILNRVANRETSTHFYFHEADHTDQYYTGRQEISNQDYLGYIIDYDKQEKILTLSERNYFKPDTEVEIFMPSGKIINYKIDKIYDENLNELECARHPQQIIKIYINEEIEKHSMIRLKVIDKK